MRGSLTDIFGEDWMKQMDKREPDPGPYSDEQVIHSKEQLTSVDQLKAGRLYLKRTTKNNTVTIFRVVNPISTERPGMADVEVHAGGDSDEWTATRYSHANLALAPYDGRHKTREGKWERRHWVEPALFD